jgi:pantoate--beta-alanine ligase
MLIARSIKEARSILKEKAKDKRVGLVPTMGYFHEGHLKLIDIARKWSDYVVVSLFVNPTQFSPGEDFQEYPRGFERDRDLAEKHGTDLLFAPSIEEMYPKEPYVKLSIKRLADHLCGPRRPGHFEGVMLVVAKLFNIIQPEVAVFGQKDAQQLFIIKRMVEDLNFPVRVISAPTVREEDGLALSSRNIYLTKSQRAQSTVLYKSLKRAKELIERGERDPRKIIEEMERMIKPKGTIDYIEVVDTENLQPLKKLKGEFMIALAVYFGRARLIDNMILEVEGEEVKEKLNE